MKQEAVKKKKKILISKEWNYSLINASKKVAMGWFSADEIVAPAVNSANTSATSTQTIALCILAAVALVYVAAKVFLKLHRQQTEQVATRAVRLSTLSQV